jgi:hypothetical protein
MSSAGRSAASEPIGGRPGSGGRSARRGPARIPHDTVLYSIGGFFADRHPELCDDVIAEAQAIEDQGLERWAAAEGAALGAAFPTLVTGLAVRYYKAVAGSA